jgi:hypothetical protein
MSHSILCGRRDGTRRHDCDEMGALPGTGVDVGFEVVAADMGACRSKRLTQELHEQGPCLAVNYQ